MSDQQCVQPILAEELLQSVLAPVIVHAFRSLPSPPARRLPGHPILIGKPRPVARRGKRRRAPGGHRISEAPMPGKIPGISAAVRARLRTARIARLATLDAERSPHLVPVCFVYHRSVFYSAIDRKPKRVAPEKLARLAHIRRTPQVALLIDYYDEDWSLLWYILVRGKAEVVPDSARAERAQAMRKLRDKYPQYAAGMLADDAPILRITPLRVRSWGKL
jgi:PPOX class probable F420-dependent enzyme